MSFPASRSERPRRRHHRLLRARPAPLSSPSPPPLSNSRRGKDGAPARLSRVIGRLCVPMCPARRRPSSPSAPLRPSGRQVPDLTAAAWAGHWAVSQLRPRGVAPGDPTRLLGLGVKGWPLSSARGVVHRSSVGMRSQGLMAAHRRRSSARPLSGLRSSGRRPLERSARTDRPSRRGSAGAARGDGRSSSRPRGALPVPRR